MKKETKAIFLGSTIGGITYAGIIAGFDFFEGVTISLIRFTSNLTFFSIFIGFFIYHRIKNQPKREN